MPTYALTSFFAPRPCSEIRGNSASWLPTPLRRATPVRLAWSGYWGKDAQFRGQLAAANGQVRPLSKWPRFGFVRLNGEGALSSMIDPQLPSRHSSRNQVNARAR